MSREHFSLSTKPWKGGDKSPFPTQTFLSKTNGSAMNETMFGVREGIYLLCCWGGKRREEVK